MWAQLCCDEIGRRHWFEIANAKLSELEKARAKEDDIRLTKWRAKYQWRHKKFPSSFSDTLSYPCYWYVAEQRILFDIIAALTTEYIGPIYINDAELKALTKSYE